MRIWKATCLNGKNAISYFEFPDKKMERDRKRCKQKLNDFQMCLHMSITET